MAPPNALYSVSYVRKEVAEAADEIERLRSALTMILKFLDHDEPWDVANLKGFNEAVSKVRKALSQARGGE